MRRLPFAEGDWRRFCYTKHNQRFAENHANTTEAIRKIYDRGKCGRRPGGVYSRRSASTAVKCRSSASRISLPGFRTEIDRSEKTEQY